MVVLGQLHMYGVQTHDNNYVIQMHASCSKIISDVQNYISDSSKHKYLKV